MEGLKMDDTDWFFAFILSGTILLFCVFGLIEQYQENIGFWKQAVKRGYAVEVHTSNGTYYRWKDLNNERH
jgi:hypothetical protein